MGSKSSTLPSSKKKVVLDPVEEPDSPDLQQFLRVVEAGDVNGLKVLMAQVCWRVLTFEL